MRSTLRQLQHSTQGTAAASSELIEAERAAAEAIARLIRASAETHSSVKDFGTQQRNMLHEAHLAAVDPVIEELFEKMEASGRRLSALQDREANQDLAVMLVLAGGFIIYVTSEIISKMAPLKAPH